MKVQSFGLDLETAEPGDMLTMEYQSNAAEIQETAKQATKDEIKEVFKKKRENFLKKRIPLRLEESIMQWLVPDWEDLAKGMQEEYMEYELRWPEKV